MIRKLAIAALVLLLGPSGQAQSPIDASALESTPSVFAAAAPDGSLDVAWRSSEGKLYLSTFSGPDYSQARQTLLSQDLQLLGGLARDESGNRYVAAYRSQANDDEWRSGYGPGIANLLRVTPADRVEPVADLNQQPFSQKWPIVNPLTLGATKDINAEIAYSNGVIAIALGHNNGTASDRHQTGLVIGVGTDGSAQYGGGGGQHIGYTRIAADGANFVQAQTFDQGLGLSTLKRGANGCQWSELILVYEIQRANQAEEAIAIAGIIPTPNHYLLVFSSGQGWLWNANDGDEKSSEIKVMKVSRDFDRLPKFDWWNGVKHQQGNFPLTTVAVPQNGKSFIRPIITSMSDGRSIVSYEQWGRSNPNGRAEPEGVRATMLDSDGNVLQQSELFGGLRIQNNTQAVFLPRHNGIGWVNGDATGNRLMLHTLNDRLELQSFELGVGKTSGEQSANGPAPERPSVPVPASQDTAPPEFAIMSFTGTEYLVTQYDTIEEQVAQSYQVNVPYTETQEIQVQENGRTVSKAVAVTKVRTEQRVRQVSVTKAVPSNFRYPLDAVTFEGPAGRAKLAQPVRNQLGNPQPVVFVPAASSLDPKFHSLFTQNTIVAKYNPLAAVRVDASDPTVQTPDATPLDFVTVAFANGEYMITRLVPVQEIRTRTVAVTKYRIQNGRRIPYTEEQEQAYTVTILKSVEQRFAHDSLNFASAAGRRGDPQLMQNFLRQARPAVMLGNAPMQANPFYRSLLNPRAMLIRQTDVQGPAPGPVPPAPLVTNVPRSMQEALQLVQNTLQSALASRARPGNIALADLVGRYEVEKPENDYHTGAISNNGGAMRWTNAADVSWKLAPDLPRGVLKTGPDCGYFRDPGGDAFTLWHGVNTRGEPTIAGFQFQERGFYLREEARRLADRLLHEAHQLRTTNKPAAVAKFCQAIQANPICASPYHGLGVALREMGHADYAVAAHSKALELVDGEALFWFDRAFAYEDMQRFEDALVDVNRSLELRDDEISREMRARLKLLINDAANRP